MTSDIETIAENFELLDDWEDRYRYVIELGRDLAPYPGDKRDDGHKVQGCVSQVWLVADTDDGPDPVLRFQGDSDAHIVRGLVAIMLAAYSGQRASAILGFDAEKLLARLGLGEHLTPQRANGLRSMIARIRHYASEALAGERAATA